MDNRLQLRLLQVARRVRSLHLGWTLATIWATAALVGWWLGTNKREGLIQSNALHWWWLSSSVALALVAFVWHSRRGRDLGRIAERVEGHFPALNQSLITAAGIRAENGRFGFLQRSVIAEAIKHDVRYGWNSIVSGVAITAGWFANVPAFLCMTIVGFSLWSVPQGEPPAPPESEEVASINLIPPEISPGNTEVERGSSLFVTARFDGALPDEVWLWHESAEADSETEPVQIAMKQSLKDPVFAAYLYGIDDSLNYRVQYADTETEAYRIDVFEYPALVRSDAKIEYPGYAGQEEKSVVDTRRVTVPMGSKVTWQLHLNKPVEVAELVAQDASSGSSLELTPSKQDPKLLTASVVLTETTIWDLKLVDAAGRDNNADISLRAKVLPNRETKIQLTAGGDSQVSPIEEFDIAAKLKDDFKVTAAGVGFQFAGGEIVERESELQPGKGKEMILSEMIDFESLGAEPRQLLSYYVWAEDRDTEGEARRTVSDMYFAEVRYFEEIYRQGEQQSQSQQQQQQQQQGQQGQQGNQQTEELLELQKQIVVGTWNVLKTARKDDMPGRAGPDIMVLSESQSQAMQLLSEKAQEAGDDPEVAKIIDSTKRFMDEAKAALTDAATSLVTADLQKALGREQAAYQALLGLQAREFDISRQQQQQQQQGQSRRSQNRQRQIDQLELKNQENPYETERQAQEQQQNDAQEEMRQIVSRLRELAARQEDINEQLRELEAALQAAETPEDREELEQQLERLREQQQQMLEDADELQERIESSENEELQETQQQMEETRENLQKTNEALRNNDTSQALASGNRAEENLKELQDEVRRQAANQFAETVQGLRNDATELEERQQEIVQELNEEAKEPNAGLRDENENEVDLKDQLARQQEQLGELLDQMEQTVIDAEEAEPLLAQKLYDSYRRTKQERAEERLEVTEQLLDRNLTPQARELADQSVEDLSNLKQEIDEAAEAVLGSEMDALRRAADQLDQLNRELDAEIADATGRGREGEEPREEQSGEPREREPVQGAPRDDQEVEPSEGEPREGQPGSGQTREGDPKEPQEGQSREGKPQQGQPGSGQPREGEPQDEQQGQPQEGQSGSGEPRAGEPQGQQERQPQQGQPQQGQPQQGQPPGLRGAREPNGQERANSQGSPFQSGANPRPLTGEDFQAWSDRLRDVEELMTDSQLRWEATQIRQAAREIRKDYRKHAADPKWAEVEDLIAKPLRDLQRKVSQELLRRAAEKTEIVPIDRDPVPSEFSKSVREYYENLGIGQ
ncbi:MAG: hypothetical protein VXZ82_12160 [Planctomycetota bacterium]|nr:hypothetical protein [Planctomycetota bacterium]